MAKKAPGKVHREGLTVVELCDMFPTEELATAWFEDVIWPDGRHCPKCGSLRTREASHAKMPYWCSDCRSYFSVKTGTAHAEVEDSAAQVGHCDLPVPDLAQVGFRP